MSTISPNCGACPVRSRSVGNRERIQASRRRRRAVVRARIALTGNDDGPAAFEMLFPLLGHDRIMMRIGAINSHLLHGRGLEPIAFGPDGKPFETLGAAGAPVDPEHVE